VALIEQIFSQLTVIQQMSAESLLDQKHFQIGRNAYKILKKKVLGAAFINP